MPFQIIRAPHTINQTAPNKPSMAPKQMHGGPEFMANRNDPRMRGASPQNVGKEVMSIVFSLFCFNPMKIRSIIRIWHFHIILLDCLLPSC